jgi:hypothetical protein
VKISDLVSVEWMQLLSARAANELFEFRRRSVSNGTLVQLTIGAEAIGGIEAILLGIARGDLDFITLRSGQLIQGLLHGIEEAPRYSSNESVAPHGVTLHKQETTRHPHVGGGATRG